MAKTKAGKKAKSRKVATRKPVARKQAVRKQAAPKPAAAQVEQAGAAAAHLDAPSAGKHPGADQSSGVKKSEAKASDKGRIALVGKGGDRVPVQVKDDAHLEQLKRAHGEGNVEVQS